MLHKSLFGVIISEKEAEGIAITFQKSLGEGQASKFHSTYPIHLWWDVPER